MALQRFRSGLLLRASLVLALVFLTGPRAQAVVIRPTFDSSITSLANAAQVESAFDAVAAQFDSALSSPVTVHITVSWGSVGGGALPAGDIGASLDNLYTGFTYADMTSCLTAAASANPLDHALAKAVLDLPTSDPTGLGNFAVPYAEAKALGLLPATQSLPDGFIGFDAAASYAFTDTSGVPAGQYDFRALAAHEISEVLGRISGLQSSRPQWASPFDLYRYAGAGVSSFSYGQGAYFSITGGVKNQGAFDAAGGGDRSDWLNENGSADAQNASFSSGQAFAVSARDFKVLNALGWDATVDPGGLGAGFGLGQSRSAAVVPEPATWILAILGLALAGAACRGRRPLARA